MTVLDGILARVARRRQNWIHMVEEILPHPRQLREVVIVGSFSLCGMQTKTRVLLESQCIPTDLGLDTPSALARDYLMVKYKHSPPATSKQIAFIRATMPKAPVYAKPCLFPHGYYIDIRAAYWSIMQVVGWDLDYSPNEWLSPGSAPSDFPWPEHKVARNCLVSAGLSAPATMYIPLDAERGYFRPIYQGNHLANVQLFRLILDVLNCVAREAVEAGAVYANTDGYIAPNLEALQGIIRAISSWGLEARVKTHGPGIVRGAGAYAIGGKIGKRPVANSHTTDNLTEVTYKHWLKKRFTAIGKLRAAGGIAERPQPYQPPQSREDKKRNENQNQKPR